MLNVLNPLIYEDNKDNIPELKTEITFEEFKQLFVAAKFKL